jgi:hypothetical protein
MAHASGKREAVERARREKTLAVNWSKMLGSDFDPDQVTVRQVSAGVPAWVLDGVLSSAECARLVQACEWTDGLGSTPYDKTYRGNTRMQTVDPALATLLWGRVQKFCPATYDTTENVPRRTGLGFENVAKHWTAVGLNERWRWAKYWPSDRFSAHTDAFFQRRDCDERSFLTVNLYLNGHATDGSHKLPTFGGGTTRFFLSGKADFATHHVVPKAGRLLLFQQPPHARLLHDGDVVEGGVKYLLRSDVMYRAERAGAP